MHVPTFWSLLYLVRIYIYTYIHRYIYTHTCICIYISCAEVWRAHLHNVSTHYTFSLYKRHLPRPCLARRSSGTCTLAARQKWRLDQAEPSPFMQSRCHIHVYVYIHIYVYTYTYVYLYACKYVYICFLYAYMHACMHVKTDRHTARQID